LGNYLSAIYQLSKEGGFYKAVLDVFFFKKRTLAVFIPQRGHVKHMKGALKLLKEEGFRLHFYTEPENVSYFMDSLGTRRVHDWRLCGRLSYGWVFTAATHIAPDRYVRKGTKVVHVPHSMVSLHTIFQTKTFRHFDVVFCCGPHHLEEVAAIASSLGRNIAAYPTGYEYIDTLASAGRAGSIAAHERRTVLVAPTWGASGLLSRFGRRVVDDLLSQYDVILRPHPYKRDLVESVIQELVADHGDGGRLVIDGDVDARPSMERADVMVSDFSGVAFEFALAYGSPVVFMDGPRKNDHIDHSRVLARDGMEVYGRSLIGTVLEDISELPAVIGDMIANAPAWEAHIAGNRDDIVYNFGHCAEVTAQRLKSLVTMDQGA